jgi:hypothetical protein
MQGAGGRVAEWQGGRGGGKEIEKKIEIEGLVIPIRWCRGVWR